MVLERLTLEAYVINENPLLSAINTIQKIDAGSLKRILLAVIGQDKEHLKPISNSLGIQPEMLDSLIISEAANRWLKSQT